MTYFKRLLREREGEIEKLTDDMKFYQLELINREQNYNTMFSANPTVGLMDPLSNSIRGAKSTNSLKSAPVAARQPRFSDHFVKIDPALLADHLPPNRLEPITTKRK